MNKVAKDLQGYPVRVGSLVVLAYKNKIAAGRVKEINNELLGILITKVHDEDPPSDLIWVESGNVYLQ